VGKSGGNVKTGRSSLQHGNSSERLQRGRNDWRGSPRRNSVGGGGGVGAELPLEFVEGPPSRPVGSQGVCPTTNNLGKDGRKGGLNMGEGAIYEPYLEK